MSVGWITKTLRPRGFTFTVCHVWSSLIAADTGNFLAHQIIKNTAGSQYLPSSNDQIIENPTENHWPPKVQLNKNQGQEIIIVSRQKNSTIVIQHLLFLSGDQLITYWNSWFKFNASCFSSLRYNLIILKKVIFV